jgi:antitoxin (DNA-binding transcriptional repressor) of toxin-antitoxin stability system
VSKAARTFSACLRRVHHGQESLELVKDGVPYALLVPVKEVNGDTHDLADALSSAILRPEDRRGWARAVREGRKHLKPLNNPWG